MVLRRPAPQHDRPRNPDRKKFGDALPELVTRHAPFPPTDATLDTSAQRPDSIPDAPRFDPTVSIPQMYSADDIDRLAIRGTFATLNYGDADWKFADRYLFDDDIPDNVERLPATPATMLDPQRQQVGALVIPDGDPTAAVVLDVHTLLSVDGNVLLQAMTDSTLQGEEAARQQLTAAYSSHDHHRVIHVHNLPPT